jgi:ABC-2 type transport system permease protein
MALHRLSALIKVNIKRMVREPAGLFMIILFPIVLTLFFGLAYGNMGGAGQQPTYQLGVVDLDSPSHWTSQFIGNLTATQILKVQVYASNETAQGDLLQGKISAVILIPGGFAQSCDSYHKFPKDRSAWNSSTVQIFLDSGSMFASQAIPPIVEQVLSTSVYGPPTEATYGPIQLGSPAMVQAAKFSTFDYMVPGLFAYAATFLTMTVAQSFTMDREKGLLRRINTTPTTSSEFMMSYTLSNMLLASMQVAMVFAMASVVGYHPKTGPLGMAFAFLLVCIFALTCVGFGLITATISKSSGAATGISFLFVLPQMFLGTFVSAGLSGSMQEVCRFVPSFYVTDALTTLFLRGAPIWSPTVLTDFTVVVLCGIVILLVGILSFRKYGKG